MSANVNKVMLGVVGTLLITSEAKKPSIEPKAEKTTKARR